MIRTALPDPANNVSAGTEEIDHSAIWAFTTSKYFYPAHQTPFLLVANQLNPGDYLLNGQPVSVSDRVFLFLNPGDRLAIDYPTRLPRQTCMILLSPEFVHRVIHYRISPIEKLLDDPLSFHAGGSAAAPGGFHIPSLPLYLDRRIRQRLERIGDYSRQGVSPDEGFFFELVSELSLLNEDTVRQIGKISAVKRSTREELYKRLTMARIFMEDHVGEPLSIGKIAREACLNRYHFLRSFKAAFASTPHQYLLKLKLEKAREYLQEKKYSVSEVCAMVGFESVGTFSNLFSRKFGVAPSRLVR